MGYEMNDFQTDVLEQSLTMPVLVDFWAEWCAPCRMIGPVLEKLAEAHKDKWRLVKIDTEQHPEIAGYLGIRSIPNVKLFIDGQVADEFSGALPEEAIVQWLQRAIPALQPGQIEQAKMLLSADRTQEARRLLQTIIANEPETEEARVLLAQIDIYSDNPVERQIAIELVRGIGPDSKFTLQSGSIQLFAKLFQPEYKVHLPESPVRAIFLEGIRQLHKRKFAEALTQFIEVVRRERGYQDEEARKTCIAIFKYLGEGHEISKKYRPVFSSAFYA